MYQKQPAVYIMTNKNHNVLYTGVTSDLVSRTFKHREELYENSFTSRYRVKILVYYELLGTMEEAIGREKQIKAGSRQRKIDLIRGMNPEWRDLGDELV